MKLELLEVVLSVQIVHQLHELARLLLVAYPENDIYELSLERCTALRAPEELEQHDLRDPYLFLGDSFAL